LTDCKLKSVSNRTTWWMRSMFETSWFAVETEVFTALHTNTNTTQVIIDDDDMKRLMITCSFSQKQTQACLT